MEETTIAAISTAMSASGIGIVRISGPEAFEIAFFLFATVLFGPLRVLAFVLVF